MLIIKVDSKDKIDRALKKYKQKYIKTGVLKAIRDKKDYKKKSVKKREQKLKAIYVQKLKESEDN